MTFADFLPTARRIAAHYARHHCRRPEDVDDLVSTVLVKLLERWKTLESLADEQRCAYARKTAKTTCIDALRAARPCEELRDDVPSDSDWQPDLGVRADDWTSAVIERVPQQKNRGNFLIVLMMKAQGHQQKDIADELKVSKPMVSRYMKMLAVAALVCLALVWCTRSPRSEPAAQADLVARGPLVAPSSAAPPGAVMEWSVECMPEGGYVYSEECPGGQVCTDGMCVIAGMSETSTGNTLQALVGYGPLQDPQYTNSVILITDGKENSECQDKTNAAAAAGALFMQPVRVRTFAVGFSDGALGSLGDVAKNGGTDTPYNANDPASLEMALDAIGNAVLSCDFVLDTPPDDPSKVHVFFHDDPAGIPNEPQNGWTYDPNSNTITFHGAACEALKNGSMIDVDVVFGCNVPIPG